MRTYLLRTVLALSVVASVGSAGRADDDVIDAVHSGVTFQISHMGVSYIPGRFNQFSGNFTIDTSDPPSSFSLTIKTESVDTNNSKRDEHLRALTSSMPSSSQRLRSPARRSKRSREATK